jgi:hypothetical protein
LEGIQRISARRKEQEQVRREATEDLADDLSEGEKGDTLAELVPVEAAKKKFQRNFSDLTVWSDDNKEKKLYIVLIRSTHLHIVSFYVTMWRKMLKYICISCNEMPAALVSFALCTSLE